MTIKNEIKVNDDVVFITGTMIRKGVVLKINKSTYKIKFNAFHWDLAGIENIKKEKVAHADDVLICFWDCKKDKNHMASHWNYIDHQQYAHKATAWLGIGYNVSESDDGIVHIHL